MGAVTVATVLIGMRGAAAEATAINLAAGNAVCPLVARHCGEVIRRAAGRNTSLIRD